MHDSCVGGPHLYSSSPPPTFRVCVTLLDGRQHVLAQKFESDRATLFDLQREVRRELLVPISLQQLALTNGELVAASLTIHNQNHPYTDPNRRVGVGGAQQQQNTNSNKANGPERCCLQYLSRDRLGKNLFSGVFLALLGEEGLEEELEMELQGDNWMEIERLDSDSDETPPCLQIFLVLAERSIADYRALYIELTRACAGGRGWEALELLREGAPVNWLVGTFDRAYELEMVEIIENERCKARRKLEKELSETNAARREGTNRGAGQQREAQGISNLNRNSIQARLLAGAVGLVEDEENHSLSFNGRKIVDIELGELEEGRKKLKEMSQIRENEVSQSYEPPDLDVEYDDGENNYDGNINDANGSYKSIENIRKLRKFMLKCCQLARRLSSDQKVGCSDKDLTAESLRKLRNKKALKGSNQEKKKERNSEKKLNQKSASESSDSDSETDGGNRTSRVPGIPQGDDLWLGPMQQMLRMHAGARDEHDGEHDSSSESEPEADLEESSSSSSNTVVFSVKKRPRYPQYAVHRAGAAQSRRQLADVPLVRSIMRAPCSGLTPLFMSRCAEAHVTTTSSSTSTTPPVIKELRLLGATLFDGRAAEEFRLTQTAPGRRRLESWTTRWETYVKSVQQSSEQKKTALDGSLQLVVPGDPRASEDLGAPEPLHPLLQTMIIQPVWEQRGIDLTPRVRMYVRDWKRMIGNVRAVVSRIREQGITRILGSLGLSMLCAASSFVGRGVSGLGGMVFNKSISNIMGGFLGTNLLFGSSSTKSRGGESDKTSSSKEGEAAATGTTAVTTSRAADEKPEETGVPATTQTELPFDETAVPPPGLLTLSWPSLGPQGSTLVCQTRYDSDSQNDSSSA